MRPDDRFDQFDGTPMDALLDADLAELDAELAGAGSYARRAHAGQARPTAAFTGRLRKRLLAGLAPETAPTGAWLGEGQPALAATRSHLVEPGEAWTPVVLSPRIAGRTHAPAPRSRWVLLAASLSSLVAATALGAGLSRVLPPPAADPTSTPASAAIVTATPSSATQAPLVVDPTVMTDPTATPTDVPVVTAPATSTPTAKPTEKPASTPKPTPKPDPTKPPIGPMDLGLKACPGGVFIDWTKPSPEVAHYHVLRSLGGDVPATYPADGTTEVESATSWSAGVTDGFDLTLDGGQTATYRAFAFDTGDNVLAWSPSRTVTTVGRIELGALVVEAAGAGSIDVSWTAADLNLACFTYGKLVASEEDPEPSYVKGSPYLVAIGDAAATGTHLDGLPSGKTVWMRYEIIRVTSLGKFVVARTDAVQVTYP